MQIDKYVSPYQQPTSFQKRYTLDDLEKDEEFQETAERFLTSVGEKSSDVFEYLRDSDFNLVQGMQRAMESGKFTDQQKQDYAYLRSRFDNADMGSLKQYFELIKDSTVDMVTDPTLLTAALTTPVTGGVSLLGRAAAGKTALEGAKLVTKSQIKNISKKDLDTLLKDRRKFTRNVTAAEVGAWTGADNYFRQKTELNTDMRKAFSNPELVGSTLIGGIAGGVFGSLAQRSADYPVRQLKKFSDDGYRKDAGSDLAYDFRRRLDVLKSKTVGKATSFLGTISEFSPTAKKLGQAVNEEFEKDLTKLTTKPLGYSYIEDLNKRRGDYFAYFDEALAPVRKTGFVSPEDEQGILRILRGDDPERIEDGVKLYSPNVKKAASNLRNFFDRILVDANEAGISVERIEDYFPRSWNRDAIVNDRPTFRKLLVDNNIVPEKEVDRVIDNMLDKQNELYASHSNLITQARKFENLDDNVFENFLNNDLIEVTVDYWSNAARIIEHENTFLKGSPKLAISGKAKLGEQEALMAYRRSNQERFSQNYIDKIDQELKEVRGKGLTRNDKKRMVDLYNSVTGQLTYYDGITQGFYDTYKLANAIAYLPLATVSSLTEAMIPLTKAKPSSAVKGLKEAIGKGLDIFTDEASTLIKDKYKLSDDLTRKEMARVWIAIDEAMGDVTNRLSGEGLQNKFLKKGARGFYKLNLLIPWTKSVQLASFATGKDLIRDNLQKLSDLQRQGVKIFDEEQMLADSINAIKDKSRFQNIVEEIPFIGSPGKNNIKRVQLLKSQLFDLGIDVEEGVKWLNRGGSTKSNFYDQVVRGAGRFTNQVILQTSREGGKLPTYFNSPKFDVFTQFLRYPTVFSNTILKNFARDVITDPASNLPRVTAFAVLATSIALATNYWRSSEEIRKKYDAEGLTNERIFDAFQRVGMLGPFEYGKRFREGLEYSPSPLVATLNLGGPINSDLIGFFQYNRGLLETAARKAPLTGARNIIDQYAGDYLEKNFGFREPYTPLKEAAREADKRIAEVIGFKRKSASSFDQPKFRKRFSEGGLAEGPEVPYTKKNPADRIDPYTGMPYAQATEVVKTPAEEQMERLGFQEGGDVSLQKSIMGVVERSFPINKEVVTETLPADKILGRNQEETEQYFSETERYFNRSDVLNYLKQKKLSKNAVIGIAANIDKETGGTYDYQQKQIGGPGYGLFQLDPTGPLPRAYEEYRKENNIEDSLEAQIDFMYETIYGDKKYRKVLGYGHGNKLKNVFEKGSPEKITEVFAAEWEKPRDYLNRKTNPEAWRKNLKDRQQRAAKLEASRAIQVMYE